VRIEALEKSKDDYVRCGHDLAGIGMTYVDSARFTVSYEYVHESGITLSKNLS